MMLSQLSNLVSLADQGLYDKLIPTVRTAKGRTELHNSRQKTLSDPGERDSFTLFTSVLKQSYRKILFEPQSASQTKPFEFGSDSSTPKLEGYSSVPVDSQKISARQAAGNILEFITERIQSDAASGADKESLLSRLDAGLSGFEKGFNEAKEQIEALGLLTPDLESEITDTYNLVTQGIENLRDVINGESSGTSGLENGVIDAGGAPISQVGSTQSTSIELERFRESNFSFEVTTQDGDVVTIDINRVKQARFSATQTDGEGGSSLQVTGERYHSNTFELTVNGELDEGELNAINSLLEEIDGIATDFYKGNLQQAFDSASELTLNKEELSSLNLELKQTTVVKAIASYQSSPQSDLTPIDSSEQQDVKTLRELLESVGEIVKHARTFAQPFKLLENVFELVTPAGGETRPVETDALPNLAKLVQDLASQFEL